MRLTSCYSYYYYYYYYYYYTNNIHFEINPLLLLRRVLLLLLIYTMNTLKRPNRPFKSIFESYAGYQVNLFQFFLWAILTQCLSIYIYIYINIYLSFYIFFLYKKIQDFQTCNIFCFEFWDIKNPYSLNSTIAIL